MDGAGLPDRAARPRRAPRPDRAAALAPARRPSIPARSFRRPTNCATESMPKLKRSEVLVPYRRNFSNGVSRADGTASLDAPRSQVPAFPRQD
jgi:hypothetical protein